MSDSSAINIILSEQSYLSSYMADGIIDDSELLSMEANTYDENGDALSLGTLQSYLGSNPEENSINLDISGVSLGETSIASAVDGLRVNQSGLIVNLKNQDNYDVAIEDGVISEEELLEMVVSGQYTLSADGQKTGITLKDYLAQNNVSLNDININFSGIDLRAEEFTVSTEIQGRETNLTGYGLSEVLGNIEGSLAETVPEESAKEIYNTLSDSCNSGTMEAVASYNVYRFSFASNAKGTKEYEAALAKSNALKNAETEWNEIISLYKEALEGINKINSAKDMTDSEITDIISSLKSKFDEFKANFGETLSEEYGEKIDSLKSMINGDNSFSLRGLFYKKINNVLQTGFFYEDIKDEFKDFFSNKSIFDDDYIES